MAIADHNRLYGMSIDGHLPATIDCARSLSISIAGHTIAGHNSLCEMSIDGHCRPHRWYKLSIDSHLAIYVSQSSILEARPNIYRGWRWLLLSYVYINSTLNKT